MPIYEFFCPICQQESSFLMRNTSLSIKPKCKTCGNTDLKRTISSFAHHKSTKTIHDESGKPSMFPSQDYYKDPRNIGRWTEKRFQDMGMEMPTGIQDKIKAAREGELPESLKELKSASSDTTYH